MNPLNVFTAYLISHKGRRWKLRWIFRNLQAFFRGFKRAYHRATRGFCNADLWDLDYFYINLFISSLRAFAKNPSGAPVKYYNGEEDSVEQWQALVNEIAQHFENSLEDSNFVTNPYDEHEDWNKWVETERKNYDLREQEFVKGWSMLGEIFHDLWD